MEARALARVLTQRRAETTSGLLLSVLATLLAACGGGGDVPGSIDSGSLLDDGGLAFDAAVPDA
jgi:hypothetical protein